VLVAPRDRVQEVKKVVERLEADGRQEHLNHREVYRPWGCYDAIDNGDRFQVKRITVKPGAKLSVQMHHHRAEHLGSGAGYREGDQRRGGASGHGEPVQLHPDRAGACAGEPGQHPVGTGRGAVGLYLAGDDIVRFDDQYEWA
jgi:mannose-1-phosphate guanylyltransferase